MDTGSARGGGARVIEIDKNEPCPDDVRGAIVVAEGLPPADVIRLTHVGGARHVIQRDAPAFLSELAFARHVGRSPERFFQHPLEMIFGTSAANSREKFSFACESHLKKTELVTRFGDFFTQIEGARPVWDRALLVADELYTNASKNSWPVGAKLFAGPPARTGQIDFFAEADQSRIVLGCRDSFGELETASLLARISSCYQNGVASAIRFGNSGAGIGSFMVFDASLSYYAGTMAGCATVICVSIPLGSKRRELEGLAKCLHVIG